MAKRRNPDDVEIPLPINLALIRGGSVDSVISVELWGPNGVPVKFGGTAHAALTIGSTATSLVSSINSAYPSGWEPSVVGGRIRVRSGGSLAINWGADDNGVLIPGASPTSASPTVLQIGQEAVFGRGRQIEVISSQLVADLTSLLTELQSVTYAEDAAHTSADPGIFVLAVRKDSEAANVGAEGDYGAIQMDDVGNVRVRIAGASPGMDATNDRVMIQPKSSAGSGGPCTNADITMHSGACTLNRMIGSCTTGGTIAISDATGAAGTAIVTFTFAAGDEIYFDFGGLAFGTGIFFDITTFVGSVMVCVGPAVA